MRGKVIIVISALAIVLAIIVGMYLTESETGLGDETLSVYADCKPMSVSQMASEIESRPYFEGYNHTTIIWLKSQKGVVFSSADAYVVMSLNDASKLPVEYATDVFINDTFTCNVKEKRPLGDGLRTSWLSIMFDSFPRILKPCHYK